MYNGESQHQRWRQMPGCQCVQECSSPTIQTSIECELYRVIDQGPTHTHTHRFYSLHHCKFFLTEEHLWNMAHPLGETIHTSNSDEGVRWWFQIDPTNTQLAGFRLSRHPQRWRYSWFQYLSPSDPEPNLQISRWLCSAMVEASCHSRCPSS